MKDDPQLNMLSSKQPASLIVKAVETNLGPFGNRTDVMVVDGSTVRGVSLLEPSPQAILVSREGHVGPGRLDSEECNDE